MNSTTEQLAFIESPFLPQGEQKYPPSILLQAVAGSGKTASSVKRLNYLIENGVDPKRIIFFSFTNDAVDELKSRVEHDVRITTIHSFTSRALATMGKYKPITNFFSFVNWYREKFKPRKSESQTIWSKYGDNVDELYDDSVNISSAISAYKLQKAEGIISHVPKFLKEYSQYQKESNSRDFSDMLIECEKLSHTRQFAVKFQGLYDYIFIDEYQDTSAIQLKILLKMKALQYHLTGDKAQAIFGFSGANCDKIEEILKKEREVIKLSLTINFRSDKSIIEYSNHYTSLAAVPNSQEEGLVNLRFINGLQLQNMLMDKNPCTVLVRTNKIIKKMELECLNYRIPMQYNNYFTAANLEDMKNNNIDIKLRQKISFIRPAFPSVTALYEFIMDNKEKPTFITTIHKAKGREYPRVVVVNSLDPEVVDENKIRLREHEWERYTFIDKRGRLVEENYNIHYVAATRAKNEMYFMLVR